MYSYKGKFGNIVCTILKNLFDMNTSNKITLLSLVSIILLNMNQLCEYISLLIIISIVCIHKDILGEFRPVLSRQKILDIDYLQA